MNKIVKSKATKVMKVSTLFKPPQPTCCFCYISKSGVYEKKRHKCKWRSGCSKCKHCSTICNLCKPVSCTSRCNLIALLIFQISPQLWGRAIWFEQEIKAAWAAKTKMLSMPVWKKDTYFAKSYKNMRMSTKA